MIKKLRIKFVAISVFSVVFVLCIIVGAINMLNYQNVVREADAILTLLQKNDGVFPEDGRQEELEDDFFQGISPELPYESRYFSAILDEDGMMVQIDMGRIAAVDEETASEYVYDILSSDKRRGFIAQYRYIKQDMQDGTMVVCLDCSRTLSNFRSFLIFSIITLVFGSFAVMLLLILFSKRVIHPVVEGHEKQKRFITDAGHEIKTPLTNIGADASVLESEYGENEWLEDIQLKVKRMAALTEDLISLARMEESEGRMRMTEFSLSDAATESVHSFRGLARTQNKTLTEEIEPGIKIVGDEKSLRRLISILLDNALKYSPEDGIIVLTVKKRRRNTVISVYNTAEYVSKESLKHLFERFYRSESSRNSETGGSGIGLAIAKAITEAHRGKISAYSADEKSLLVTVTL